MCADPNNLPFSNRAGEGFENALATLVAGELGKTVSYTWFPQRRGFVRNTLASGRCDDIIGVPVHYGMAATTLPYYRSSYVFVTRPDRHLDIDSFDDPRLAQLRIGVHTIGDDYANVPPAQALAAHGIVGNLRGYSIYGDYSRPDPPRDLIDAVAEGEVDVAIAWGPLAGYFAQREQSPLAMRIARPSGLATAPMTFGIAMGVRREDAALRAALDGMITRRVDRATLHHEPAGPFAVRRRQRKPSRQPLPRRTARCHRHRPGLRRHHHLRRRGAAVPRQDARGRARRERRHALRRPRDRQTPARQGRTRTGKGCGADDITYSSVDGPSLYTHPLCFNTWRNGVKLGDEPPASGY